MPQPSRRVDPEPIAVGLSILGALGSVVRIIDVLARLSIIQAGLRTRQLQKIAAALDTAERAAIELRAKLDVLETFVRTTPTIEQHVQGRAQLGFGSTRPVLSLAALEEWRHLQESTLRLSGQLQASVIQVLKVYATSRTSLPETTGDESHGVIDALNFAIAGLMTGHDLLQWIETLRRASDAVVTMLRDARRQVTS